MFATSVRFPLARAGERIVNHGAPVRETQEIAVVRERLRR
jgi:hypothetical protein